MSINIEEYNKCNECKHLHSELYMKMPDGNHLYSYWCNMNLQYGQVKCDKFESKEITNEKN